MESLSDIVAEMRTRSREVKEAFGGRPDGVENMLDIWAGRIEAVAKRDAAIHAMTCEANERLREHLEIALEDNERPVGNAAAMREALVEIRDCIKEHPCQLDEDAVFEIVTKALNEKPRNCDLFGGDPKMLNTAWFDWTASPSGHDAIGVAKMTFAGWLLAPAAELKKEGKGDGAR